MRVAPDSCAAFSIIAAISGTGTYISKRSTACGDLATRRRVSSRGPGASASKDLIQRLDGTRARSAPHQGTSPVLRRCATVSRRRRQWSGISDLELSVGEVDGVDGVGDPLIVSTKEVSCDNAASASDNLVLDVAKRDRSSSKSATGLFA